MILRPLTSLFKEDIASTAKYINNLVISWVILRQLHKVLIEIFLPFFINNLVIGWVILRQISKGCFWLRVIFINNLVIGWVILRPFKLNFATLSKSLLTI